MCVRMWRVGGDGDINLTILLSFSLIKMVALMIKSLLGVLESKANWRNGSL